jgi:ribosomal subunit interface protein
MRITTKTTGAVALTGELRTFVEEKIEKLGKLLDPKDTTVLAEVELESISQSKTGDLFRAEINLTFAGGFARAEASGETLHAAIDTAVAEAKREVQHVRVKRRNLIRRGAAKVKDFLRRFER